MLNMFQKLEPIRDFMYRERFDDLNNEDLEKMFKQGSRRDKKNSAIYGLQITVDSFIQEQTSPEEYQNVKEQAEEAVKRYYNGENFEEMSFQLPELETTTRWTGLPGLEFLTDRETTSIAETYNPDRVVAIASGGIEPGILTSHKTDSELDIIRYSKRDHQDDEVYDWNPNYKGENVLVVDDTAITGETIQEAANYVSRNGAETVYSEVISDIGSHTLRELNPF